MTVPAQTPINRHTGNGVTTIFPFTFKVLQAGDLEVSIGGFVQSSGFTVSGVGANAGDVTFTVPPAAGAVVVLRRVMAIQRTTDYQDQGAMPAATVDDDHDATVMMVQQVAAVQSSALQYPVLEGISGTLPAAADRAGKLLAFDTAGRPTMAVPVADSSTDVRIDLVSPAVDKGSALVAFDGALNYAAGTIGHAVNKSGLNITMQPWSCVGDGATNNASGLNAACAIGRKLIVPSGVYYCADNITVTLAAGQDMVLVGDGEESSIIRFAAGKGFIINTPEATGSDGDRVALIVRGVGLETLGNGDATAITYRSGSTGTGAGTGVGFRLRELRFSGATASTYWREAVDAENFSFFDYDDLLIQGPNSSADCTGLKLNATKDSVDNFFGAIRCRNVTHPFKITGRFEGIYISRLLAMGGVKVGVEWVASLDAGEFRQPLLVVDHFHINASERAIRTVDVAQVIVNTGLIYIDNVSATETVGIEMTGTNASVDTLANIGAGVTIMGQGSRSGCNSKAVKTDSNTKRVKIDGLVNNVNTVVDAAAGTAVIFSPGAAAWAYDTRMTNATALGTAFTATATLSVDAGIQREHTTGTLYERDMAREQLRVFSYLHTVATADDTVDIALGQSFRTDIQGGVVCFGSNNVPTGARVDLDLGGSTNTTIRVRVKGATVASSVRVQGVIYGY